MYEVAVQGTFTATHQIPRPDETLEPRHGHDWRVRAVWGGPRLDHRGLLLDFTAAEQALRDLTAELHQTHLNDNPLLAGEPPTGENVARILFEKLDSAHRSSDARLARVCIEEAPGCAATYARD